MPNPIEAFIKYTKKIKPAIVHTKKCKIQFKRTASTETDFISTPPVSDKHVSFMNISYPGKMISHEEINIFEADGKSELINHAELKEINELQLDVQSVDKKIDPTERFKLIAKNIISRLHSGEIAVCLQEVPVEPDFRNKLANYLEQEDVKQSAGNLNKRVFDKDSFEKSFTQTTSFLKDNNYRRKVYGTAAVLNKRLIKKNVFEKLPVKQPDEKGTAAAVIYKLETNEGDPLHILNVHLPKPENSDAKGYEHQKACMEKISDIASIRQFGEVAIDVVGGDFNKPSHELVNTFKDGKDDVETVIDEKGVMSMVITRRAQANIKKAQLSAEEKIEKAKRIRTVKNLQAIWQQRHRNIVPDIKNIKNDSKAFLAELTAKVNTGAESKKVITKDSLLEYAAMSLYKAHKSTTTNVKFAKAELIHRSKNIASSDTELKLSDGKQEAKLGNAIELTYSYDVKTGDSKVTTNQFSVRISELESTNLKLDETDLKGDELKDAADKNVEYSVSIIAGESITNNETLLRNMLNAVLANPLWKNKPLHISHLSKTQEEILMKIMSENIKKLQDKGMLNPNMIIVHKEDGVEEAITKEALKKIAKDSSPAGGLRFATSRSGPR